MAKAQGVWKYQDSVLVQIDYRKGMFDMVESVGGLSQLAHRTAIERLTAAGAVPNTSLALVTELFRDWKSPVAGKAREILKTYLAEVKQVKYGTRQPFAPSARSDLTASPERAFSLLRRRAIRDACQRFGIGERDMNKLMFAAAIILSAGMAHAAEPAGAKPQGTKAEQPQSNPATTRTTGVVKGLDAVGGTLMLAHEPVPSLNWPAMTMPFKISPALAKGIQVGQKVNVEFQAQGMNGTITKITVAK